VLLDHQELIGLLVEVEVLEILQLVKVVEQVVDLEDLMLVLEMVVMEAHLEVLDQV
tara:strand:- start:139 stop:306 length:168 start_codon:yes stop_codon:yes gene_type:complete